MAGDLSTRNVHRTTDKTLCLFGVFREPERCTGQLEFTFTSQ